MATYIHGSLAAAEQVRTPQETALTRKVVTRRRTIPTAEKLLYLLTIAMCVVVAGGIIWRYAQIYQMNVQIQQVDAQIKALQSENDAMQIEARRLQDPKRLLKLGGELGFVSSDDQHVSEIPSQSDLSASGHHVALK